MKLKSVLAAVCVVITQTSLSAAEVIQYFGYENAIEIRNSRVRVVVASQSGGRILEYSLDGRNVLYLSDAEKNWIPKDKPQSSAGRFDIGPEYVVPKRPTLWSGDWTHQIIGSHSVRLTSPEDTATGVKLIRDYILAKDSSRLECRQTIVNVSNERKEWCHWSRTFVVGKGVAWIPLTPADRVPFSRFPNDYVMYEGRGLINARPEDKQIRRVANALQVFPTPQYPKLGFDSYAGQIGYAAPNGLYFLKEFKTFPDRVYNEVAGLTISVWYPDGPMVELEPIGPREVLAPGESASFSEFWWLGPMPFPGTESDINNSDFEAATAAAKAHFSN